MKQIFLVGPMGSGKTTVGQLLAKSLKLNFYDTDAEITAIAGQSISAIFSSKGEDYFRQLESNIIDNVGSGVIATGGGLPVFNNNMQRLKKKGLVLYLQVSCQHAMSRIVNDGNRPLLKGNETEQQALWSELLAQREAIYLEAHHTVNGNQLANVVVDNLIDLLKKN